MRQPHRARRTLSMCSVPIALIAIVCVLAAAATPSAAADPGSSGTGVTEPVDLNRSDVKELMALPGIGKAMAERIVAFRKEHGPFRRAEDLMRVKGIGEKSFQKLKPLVKIGGKSKAG